MIAAFIAALFIADAIIFIYFQAKIVKLFELLSEQPEEKDTKEKIPIEDQWKNFLSYSGRGK